MSTGFYPRYDQLGASSRYRFFTCYNEWLKRDPAADILLKPGLSDTYLKKLYRTGRVPLIRGCWENFRMLMRGFSLPEKLIIPYFPDSPMVTIFPRFPAYSMSLARWKTVCFRLFDFRFRTGLAVHLRQG